MNFILVAQVIICDEKSYLKVSPGNKPFGLVGKEQDGSTLEIIAFLELQVV